MALSIISAHTCDSLLAITLHKTNTLHFGLTLWCEGAFAYQKLNGSSLKRRVYNFFYGPHQRGIKDWRLFVRYLWLIHCRKTSFIEAVQSFHTKIQHLPKLTPQQPAVKQQSAAQTNWKDSHSFKKKYYIVFGTLHLLPTLTMCAVPLKNTMRSAFVVLSFFGRA